MSKNQKLEVEKWTNYYLNLDSFLQPNEYLLKLLIGNYEGKKNFLSGKKSWRKTFSKLNVLDLSCGDGRNLILLDKLGFNVFATEISDEICQIVCENLKKHQINELQIKTGFNNSIPFKNNFFDFLVSWNALYYLDHKNHKISENLNEISRVLKKDGIFIGSIPGPKCYSVLGGTKVGASQVEINPTTNSNWGGGLLNNTILYLVETKQHLQEILSDKFYEIEISELFWDGFGSAPLHYFMFISKKK